MKPNFLVVGAAKSATTWLYKCFYEHPEIFVPTLKEVDFFSYNYDKGYEWYLSFFTLNDEKAVGEISPSYMSNPDIPSRIQEFNPNIKLIFLLRNPIQRAYSHYCMELRYNTVSENIDEELTSESSIVKEGLYYRYISRFANLFPSENIKIIIYNDLKNNVDSVLEDTFSFLGVNPKFRSEEMFKSRYSKMPRQRFAKLYGYLADIYRYINTSSKLGSNIITFFKDKGLNDKFHNLNSSSESYPLLTLEKKRTLAEFYSKEISLLSEYIDRDLSFWLDIDY
jgi:hypothetical protein